MQLLPVTSAVESLLENSSVVVPTRSPVELRFVGGATPSIRVEVPSDAARTVSLAYVILMSDVPTDDEPDFPGASVWLRDWNIWGEASDRVGCVLLEALRSSSASNGSVEDRPVMFMDAGEIGIAHAALTLALLFQWDAYYLPGSKQWIAFVSHDGYVDIMASYRAVHARLFDRLSRGGWAPSETR